MSEAARRGAGFAAARRRSAWLFVTPLLMVLAVVAALPLARTIALSLTDAQIDGLQGSFVGLENYFGEYGLFGGSEGWIEPRWGRAIANTVLFALVSVSLETVLALAFALLLNQEFRGKRLVASAVLVPWAIPTAVSTRIWDWMLQQQYGAVNAGLAALGWERIAFTTDYPLLTVIAVDVWKTTPFMALLMLAALKMLPQDCYEAARVDGIGPLKVFARVTLPLIQPAVAVAVIFRLLDAMRVFDVIYILLGTTDATISMSGYVRDQMIENGNVGLGSAASTVLFLIVAALTILYMRMARLRP